MKSSPEEAAAVLRKWRDDETLVNVIAQFPDLESHDFWTKLSEVDDERVLLAGEYCIFQVPFAGSDISFVDPKIEAPPDFPLRAKLAKIDSALFFHRARGTIVLIARANTEGHSAEELRLRHKSRK
jgi:hypothetical protein